MRALLSVADKTGVVDLAISLATEGWDLVSSGGTANKLRDAGLTVTDTAEITGVPAILGHRVVTLHPKIHGGILADRNEPQHLADMEQYGIECFDLVVCNVYDFAGNPGIEQIDIGGPAMLRAAAKNSLFVASVCDKADYAMVVEEIQQCGGVTLGTRERLAAKLFRFTSNYDAAIADFLEGKLLPS